MLQNKDAVAKWIDALASFHGEDVYNPWADYDPSTDLTEDGAAIRRYQLAQYLRSRWGQAELIIIAEAAGYQGARFSGIALTCERMLLGHHPVVAPDAIFKGLKRRTSNPDGPAVVGRPVQYGFLEPTDTVVWKAMIENQVDTTRVLLWNMFPFHPHRPGEPLTNRTPHKGELDIGWTYLRPLLEAHPDAAVLAVGKKAEKTLQRYGVAATALRHPANGGAKLYAQQFKAFVQAHMTE